MLNEEIMDFMIDNINKNPSKKLQEVKSDISEEEAMQIYHELIQLFSKHNVSYQCAIRLSIAWNEALMRGAVALYKMDKL